MMYDKTFEELNIGDSFETATGLWIVFDKGVETLIAYRQDENKLPQDAEHIIFYNYEFP